MADLPELDPEIHQRTRLRIMALLYRNRRARATWLRDELGLTDGNLASHASRLEEVGYVAARRALTPNGFQLEYRLTGRGDEAFRSYLNGLRALVGLDEADAPERRADGPADAAAM